MERDSWSKRKRAGHLVNKKTWHKSGGVCAKSWNKEGGVRAKSWNKVGGD